MKISVAMAYYNGGMYIEEQMDTILTQLGEQDEVEELYRILGKHKKQYSSWDFNVITAFDKFELPFGRKATKNRKLYNGKLKCFFYQYFDNELIKGQGDTVMQELIRKS